MVGAPFYIPANSAQDSQCLHSHANICHFQVFGLVCDLMEAIQRDVKWCTIVVSVCVSLMIGDVVMHLFLLM